MPATVTTKPTYAVPKQPTTVIFTPANGATNYIRVWATTAPEGTALRKKIDASKLNRALIFQGQAGSDHPWRTTFEKGGAYALTLQEYTRGNSWGGGYENDPRGAPSETKVGAEQSLTLYIAQRLTQQIGAGSDTATLVLHVVNGHVRPTTVAVHGEATPAIVEPSSDKAAAAVADSVTVGTDLYTALNLLSNDTVLGIGGTIDADFVRSLVQEFADHAANDGGTWHQNSDTTNAAIDPTFLVATSETSLEAMATSVNKVRAVFSLHIQNATEASPTPGSVTHHDQGGLRTDLAHQLLPITADAGDPATIFAAAADYVRAHELHRVATMHENPDTVNTLTLTARPLANVHRRFLEALTEPFVSPPAGQTSGATTLVTYAGFQES